MKKIILVILAVILFSGCIGDLNKLDKIIDSADLAMRQHLGDTVIILKDTSIIIDYSIFDENYTLSNGTTIHELLVEELEK